MEVTTARSACTTTLQGLLISVCFVGCAAPIDAPSAFTEQRYVCTPDLTLEFDAEVAACRDAWSRYGSCAGRVSLRGVIDAQPVVANTAVTKVTQALNVDGDQTLHGMVLEAKAPYFVYRFRFMSLEKSSDELHYAGTAIGGSDYINLEARGGNYLSNLVRESRNVEALSADEVRFAFTTDLERGGHLEGCLDAFLPPP